MKRKPVEIKDDALARILLMIQEEEERLRSVQVQTRDAQRALRGITQSVVEYGRLMRLKVEKAKKPKKNSSAR